MKALVYHGAERLEYGETTDATATEDCALVRISACGICGSDMHAYLGHDPRRPPPLILGHEAAGTVIAGGGAKFPAGSRVAINPLVPCGECAPCRRGRSNICAGRELLSMPPRQGAFAECASVPARNLTPVPDDFPLEKASLAEPLSCGLHAVRVGLSLFPDGRGANEMSAVVLGGGGIGWGIALHLRASGVSKIAVAESNDLRRKTLTARNEFTVVHPDALTAGEADIVLDAVGVSATRKRACEIVSAGGRIIHIGLGGGEGGVDARRLTLWEIAFAGVYCFTADDFTETTRRMFSGELGPLDWTERRPLSEGATAFAALKSGKVPAPKITLLT